MSTINSAYSGQYYQLPTTGAATATAATKTASATTGAASDAANSSLAYLLDLSPQAQSYLATQKSTTASSTSFTISPADQKKIDDIIDKYKDAPLTQDTYNHIQNDLTDAGVSARQLAQKEAIAAFNPTQALISALNGTEYNFPSASGTDAQAKSDNFMKQVYDKWQAVAGPTASS